MTLTKANLAGKLALVTGATGSIGSALCKRLAQEKVNLVLMSKTEEKLAHLSRELDGFDVDVSAISCDMSVAEELNECLDTQIGKLRPDILVNAAGVFPNKDIQSTSIEEYESVIRVNLTAAFLLCRDITPKMCESKWGRVVNLGSSSSYGGFKNTTAYCISKHGLLGLSRSLHSEVKHNGVRVYHISPSSTKGNMGLATVGQDYSTFIEPSEIADCIMFAIQQDGNAMLEELFVKRMEVR